MLNGERELPSIGERSEKGATVAVDEVGFGDGAADLSSQTVQVSCLH
jgi:hypothetical protein